MEKLTSILVVIDPHDGSPHAIAKSMRLARCFGAAVEFFLCDSERAYALSRTYDPSSAARDREAYFADGMGFLESLRRSVGASDVEVTLHVACESPLYESIVRRVLQSRPDLVVKSPSGQRRPGGLSLDENDWQLARTCPATLMFARSSPWRVQPRFGAAVDVSEQEPSGFARRIMHACSALALGCRAQPEAMYSERHPEDAGGCRERAVALRELASEFNVKPDRAHVLLGHAEETLPQLAQRRRFDVLVLGALTHREGLARLVGTLTSQLVDAIDCDFVLVKPAAYRCPVPPRQPASRGARRSAHLH